MCGIVAVINKNHSPVELDNLRQMASVINHRGPDDEGFFIDGRVGFFHKRLSIIDLANGHQPMTIDDLTIVFNGEIYNYVELREELKNQGVSFRTNSDTEVILKMYEVYGNECIKKFNGMFAFLIYNKVRRTLFIGRDHFGIKPLYYYSDDEHLIFASEIKSILEHPAVEAIPDYYSINEYLTFQYLLSNKTLFRNILKILPGSFMTIELDSGKTYYTKYWEPKFVVNKTISEEQFQAELRNLMEDALKIQMRSDVPVGAHLSGGIDSSLVSLLGSKHSQNGFKTFVGAFNEGSKFNEIKYAQIVAKATASELYEIFPSEDDFFELLPKLIYHLDEPAAGPGVYPQYMVSKLASENVKVVLGGQGGDEIFGGYARYVVAYLEQAIKGEIFQNNEEGEHIVSLKSILPNLPFLRAYVPMMKEFWRDEAFDPMDRRYFRLINRMNDSLFNLTDDFVASYDEEIIYSRFRNLFNHPETLSYYNKMTHFDIIANLPALLHVEDRVSMAVSLESRVPLLDYRVVDLVSRMPPAMKFKGAEMKYILKRTFKDVLPQEIYFRKDKMGFPVPIHLWFKNDRKNFLHDTLLSQKSKERGIINASQIEKLINEERAFGRKIWGILCLELWFNQFIDNKKSPVKHDKYDISTN